MRRHTFSGSPFTQTVGWLGVLLILVAYACLTFDVFSAQSFWYQSLNFVGAFAIVVETGFKRDLQPMTLNIIWALVAIVGFVRAFQP